MSTHCAVNLQYQPQLLAQGLTHLLCCFLQPGALSGCSGTKPGSKSSWVSLHCCSELLQPATALPGGSNPKTPARELAPAGNPILGVQCSPQWRHYLVKMLTSTLYASGNSANILCWGCDHLYSAVMCKWTPKFSFICLCAHEYLTPWAKCSNLCVQLAVGPSVRTTPQFVYGDFCVTNTTYSQHTTILFINLVKSTQNHVQMSALFPLSNWSFSLGAWVDSQLLLTVTRQYCKTNFNIGLPAVTYTLIVNQVISFHIIAMVTTLTVQL